MSGELGRLLSTHPVDCRHRWSRALWGVLFLVLGLGGLVWVAFFPELGGVSTSELTPNGEAVIITTHDNTIEKYLFAFGLVAIAIGAWLAGVNLPRAVRGGRRETFQVRSRGLVHRGWRVRRWTWQEVTSVRVSWPDTAAVSLMPTFACIVRFADGRRVRVDRDTDDGVRLARTIVARCPEVVEEAQPLMSRVPQWLVWVMLTFFLCAAAPLIWYLSAWDSASDDRAFMLVFFGLMVCVAGVGACAYVLPHLRRRKP